jgi:hypothetical protein
MAITEIVENPLSKAIVLRSQVEWGAVFSGAAIATAVGLTLLTFGAALGLSVASPFPGNGMSPAAFAIAAGLYLLWVHLMSFFIGGYVAARLRGSDPSASEHEVDVRDGLHGLVVWAIGAIAAAVIAYAGIGGISASTHDPQNQISASISQVANRQINSSAVSDQHSSVNAEDTSAAQRRVETARKLSIVSAFMSAAALLAGAVAAFFGAHSGGHHRDKKLALEFFRSQAR